MGSRFHPGVALSLPVLLPCVTVLGLGLAWPSAAGVIRQCGDGTGGVVLTDAESCPAGTREERAVEFQRSRSGSSAADERRRALSIYQSDPVPAPSAKKSSVAAETRIREAKNAACADLDERSREIRARMRLGYSAEKGEQLMRKDRTIEADRCRLGCVPC